MGKAKLNYDYQPCLSMIEVNGKVYEVSLSEAIEYGRSKKIPSRLKKKIEEK